MFDGSVIRPAGPTCMASGRVIDYFLVSRGLLARGAQVVAGSPVYPHAPVFVEIAKQCVEGAMRVAQGPRAFPE
eukprot:4940313-Pyramimonas_sp.AAC.1